MVVRYSYPYVRPSVNYSLTETSQYRRLVLFVEEIDAVAEATDDSTLHGLLGELHADLRRLA